MNVSMRRAALVICILLIAMTAAWGMGSREDPLVYADTLIADQKYDQAILYLTEFMKQYPDRFDAAQQRLRRITKLRAAYNDKAFSLLDTMVKEPTNEEKKITMIRDLENLERNPNPAVKEFITQTKYLALFTYNRAKFEEIMANGRVLIDNRKFAEAVRLYESGFVLYRPEFTDGSFEQAVVDDSFQRVSIISGDIIRFTNGLGALNDSFAALAAAYRSGDDKATVEAWKQAEAEALSVAAIRAEIVNEGRALEQTFATISANNPSATDNSFLPFAFRLILGRKTEGKLEGVAGAIDAGWAGALGSAQTALDDTLKAGIELARSDYDAGNWAAAIAGFDAAATVADHGVGLVSLWSHYIASDLVERSTPLGQAALKLKGSDYLRYLQTASLARTYSRLATIQTGVDAEKAGLAAYAPPANARTEALAAYNARAAAFVKAYGSIQGLRDESGTLAQRLSAWTKAGYGSDVLSTEQGLLDGRLSLASDNARALETQAIAKAAAYEYGILAATLKAAENNIASGSNLLAGVPSDDPLLPDAVFKYPGKALATLGSADTALKGLRTAIDAFLASYRSRPGYIASDASVQEWLTRAADLATATGATVAQNAALITQASEQKRLADSARLEAERRVAESKAALKANNFDGARERLERARERYLASLSFEQDPLLRAESDKLLSELATTILKTENDLVVTETRRLLTSGKDLYLQGEFDRAETTLLQARSRWSTTNTTPEVEVEYWLKLVQTALSVKTGRDIPVTAPLFPEMSQLLSLAKLYYEDGASLLAKRDKTGAIKSFNQARQKISEVKVVFPLNQEARVLELKIDQLSDPDQFAAKFARMFNEARLKVDAKADLTTAYSDLKDLEAINPRYTGLRALIERTEILLGFRQPPPDPKAIAQSRSLVQAAQRIFDSGQVTQFAFARTQLEQAILLDPNNEAASKLKDRIATYIGGDTAIVLSSAAEALYNDAVGFFTSGDYLNARARLTRLVAIFPRGMSVQKVSDLDSRLSARGY